MSGDHGRILSSLVTLLVLVVSISVVGPAYGQEFQVRGTVTSGTDGMPLPGASIVEEGTTTGTSTNAQGQYTLEVSGPNTRSEEHTSELQSRENLVCRLLLE